MSTAVYLIIAGLVTVGVIVVRVRARFPGAKLGDFVRVAVPRELPPGERLARGTRLDIAAELQKAGQDPDELRRLVEAGEDQLLLQRYWAWRAWGPS